MSNLFWLTDEQLAAIEAAIPKKRRGVKARRAPGELVRPWHQPDLSRYDGALRHRDPANAGVQAARQGQGGSWRSGGGAVDPGAVAQPAFLLAG